MVKDNQRGRLVVAMCGWLAFALLSVSFVYAAERGVVLVYDAQGEHAKSSTARTALVLGNGSYPEAPLKNPVNDATDVAEALRGLGFEVVLSLDVDKRVLMRAMRKFRQRLHRRGGIGLFYYAGHGIQVRGRNYLIPVGADIETEADVEYAAVDAGLVLRYMEEAEARLNIVILDACRNNPIERSWRSANRGLVRLELPQGPLGSLLAYSTAPGKVAADGNGRNSPFTKHLLLNLGIAGLDLEDVFKKTRIGVKRDTDGKQIPWSESSLVGDFYFQHSTLIDDGPQVYSAILPPKRVPEKASLTIRSNVYEDRVYIDGQEMGSTRLDVELAPGRHSVRVEKEAYTPHEETFELKAGRNPALRATLSKVPVRAEPATAQPPPVTLAPNTAVAPNTASEPQKGETWIEPITGMEFVWIPSGCFEMGVPKELVSHETAPQHRVCVEGFWLGKHEVTNAQFRRFRSDHDSDFLDYPLNGDEQPVVQVNWFTATDFAAWLSQNSGEHFRLPTEAEWEYAARAGSASRGYVDWATEDETCNYDNMYDKTAATSGLLGTLQFDQLKDSCEDGYVYTAPVGSFRPNSFGLYDMLGNVWEWTCSAYDAAYKGAELECANKNSHVPRVYRGGYFHMTWWETNSTDRRKEGPGVRPTTDKGFRLARTP